MHLQSLKLLRQTVEEMHFQESTVSAFDLDLAVTQDVAQYPLHHVTYAPAKFLVASSHSFIVWEGMHLQENTFFDLDIGF